MMKFAYPVVVGTAEIPGQRWQLDQYREIVRCIPDGRALVLEFESHADLLHGQRILHDAALRVFGERGCIRTKRNGYATGGLQLLVWRTTARVAEPVPLVMSIPVGRDKSR